MKNIDLKDYATPEKQEARSFLRERFLRVLSSISDKPCTLKMYDKSSVSATFGGIDLDVLKLYAKDVQTPTFQHPHALIRTSDILSIEVPDASFQKLIEPQKDGENGTAQCDMDTA